MLLCQVFGTSTSASVFFCMRMVVGLRATTNWASPWHGILNGSNKQLHVLSGYAALAVWKFASYVATLLRTLERYYFWNGFDKWIVEAAVYGPGCGWGRSFYFSRCTMDDFDVMVASAVCFAAGHRKIYPDNRWVKRSRTWKVDAYIFNGKFQYKIFAVGITWAHGLTSPKTPVSGSNIAPTSFFSTFSCTVCTYNVLACHFLCPKWAAARHTRPKSKKVLHFVSLRPTMAAYGPASCEFDKHRPKKKKTAEHWNYGSAVPRFGTPTLSLLEHVGTTISFFSVSAPPLTFPTIPNIWCGVTRCLQGMMGHRLCVSGTHKVPNQNKCTKAWHEPLVRRTLQKIQDVATNRPRLRTQIFTSAFRVTCVTCLALILDSGCAKFRATDSSSKSPTNGYQVFSCPHYKCTGAQLQASQVKSSQVSPNARRRAQCKGQASDGYHDGITNIHNIRTVSAGNISAYKIPFNGKEGAIHRLQMAIHIRTCIL